MENERFSKYGSRLKAAHIHYVGLTKFHGLRAARFQNVALALAPRTFVLKSEEVRGLPWSTYYTWCSGRIENCEGAAITLVR
eukprot:7119744-Pyramimonas_sp.AAC.1